MAFHHHRFFKIAWEGFLLIIAAYIYVFLIRAGALCSWMQW